MGDMKNNKIAPVDLRPTHSKGDIYTYSSEVLTNVSQIVSINGSGGFPPKLPDHVCRERKLRTQSS